MKRIIALVLAVLCIPCAALAEQYVNSFKGTPVFSIEYNPNDFELDDLAFEHENTASYEWCFMMYSEKYFIYCEMEYVPGYEKFSLFSATEEEIKEYVDMLCEANSEYDAEYSETYKITVTNGKKSAVLPFVILHMNDSEFGETYYAETVSNGCAIYFEIYDDNPKRPSADKKQILLSLLDTFAPIP